MIKNKTTFLVFWAIHFLSAIGSLLISLVWTFSILDDLNPQDIAPLGLQVLGLISTIFTTPLFTLFGAKLLSNSSIWLTAFELLLNSFVVCYVLVFIWEKFRQNKQIPTPSQTTP